MSSVEQNNNNSQEKNELETPKPNQESSKIQPSQEILNNPYVQELLLKIDVLKRGIFKNYHQN